jgi:ABC-2 type transport system permease protein
MSEPTITPPTVAIVGERPRYQLSWHGVLRSEWSKLWSLRSTPITLALALVILLALGILTSALFHPSSAPPSGNAAIPTGPVSLALSGVSIAQLAIGVLGVLVTAGEYSTGMIRSTLAAVPRRLPVLWAKATTYGGIAFVVSTVGVVVAFLVGSLVLPEGSESIGLTDGGVARSLAGAGLYLAIVAVIGAALGAVLRSVAGAIAVLVAVLLILPTLLLALPSGISHAISPYLPSTAGQAVYALHQTGDLVSPAVGALTLVAWAAVALGAAAWRLAKTDV